MVAAAGCNREQWSSWLKDLGATERQIERFHRLGKLDDWTYAELKAQIETEKLRLNSQHDAPAFQPADPLETQSILRRSRQSQSRSPLQRKRRRPSYRCRLQLLKHRLVAPKKRS